MRTARHDIAMKNVLRQALAFVTCLLQGFQNLYFRDFSVYCEHARWIGEVYRPVAVTGGFIEEGSHFFYAAFALDIGFKLLLFHNRLIYYTN